jgi:hypothetical protein
LLARGVTQFHQQEGDAGLTRLLATFAQDGHHMSQSGLRDHPGLHQAVTQR